MKRWDIVGENLDVLEFTAKLNRVGTELELSCTMRGTLAGYPGCVHWHFKRGEEKGVVEVTLWKGNAWVTVQAGRSTAEVEALAERLAGLVGAS